VFVLLHRGTVGGALFTLAHAQTILPTNISVFTLTATSEWQNGIKISEDSSKNVIYMTMTFSSINS